MSFAMASLLAHSDYVPESARLVLQVAGDAPPALRVGLLESAAKILHDEAGIECADARELVDLQPKE
jgi:hypothetical protein